MSTKLSERVLDKVELADDQQQLVLWDEELPCFGVVIGKKRATFVVQFRAIDSETGSKAKRRLVVGRRGEVRADGHPWTVVLARQRARELLGQVAGGGDPSRGRRSPASAPTLTDAFDLHLDRMRADRASASSIATITRERDKYLAAWLQRPLNTIERAHCR